MVMVILMVMVMMVIAMVVTVMMMVVVMVVVSVCIGAGVWIIHILIKIMTKLEVYSYIPTVCYYRDPCTGSTVNPISHLKETHTASTTWKITLCDNPSQTLTTKTISDVELVTMKRRQQYPEEGLTNLKKSAQ